MGFVRFSLLGLLLVLWGQAGVLHSGRDLGPELLLAGLGAAQGAQQALELVLTARRPHKCLQTFGMSFHFYWCTTVSVADPKCSFYHDQKPAQIPDPTITKKGVEKITCLAFFVA